MWRKREVEQLRIMEEQRAMDEFLTFLLEDRELDIDQVRFLFLEQYPHEEYYMESFISDYLS
jgi:hypothetical protein